MRLFAAAAMLLSTLPLHAEAPPIIRRAPEFVVHLPDGNQFTLRSLQGKVVALLFVHTTCPHCQQASQAFTRLYTEFGARGFQPVDVAFNPMANMYVKDFVNNFGIKYPVGFSPPEDVLSFMGFSPMERHVVPQIVWIDRAGNIRSQSPPMGEEKLLREPYWREMINTLLKEPAQSAKKRPARPTQAKKAAAQ